VHFDLSSAVWIDPLVLAFVVAALWIVFRDIGNILTRRARNAKREATERNAKLDLMLEDWTGADARPGVVAIPGVMSRLMTIEDHLKVIDKEVTFNSGSSTKDAVYRIDRKVNKLTDSLAHHRQDFQEVTSPRREGTWTADS
jgi:hypothetical protein